MKAKAIEDNNMWWGIVEDEDGNEIHRSATGFFFKEFALKRMHWWMARERRGKIEQANKDSERAKRSYHRLKKIRFRW